MMLQELVVVTPSAMSCAQCSKMSLCIMRRQRRRKDGLKPIQIGAWNNNREVVELLLPLTSPNPGVSNWNVDGITAMTKEFEEKPQSNEATLKSGGPQPAEATELDLNDATVLSNRSLCWLRAGQANRALEDAKACRALRPDWVKACYREGAAHRLLRTEI